MEKYISRLKEINKEKLTEREFIEEVLTIIKDMDNVELSFEDFEQLKNTLKEIGCRTYNDWKAEKEKNGEIVEKGTIGEGINYAELGTGISFIDQLLRTYETASFSLPYMLDGGEENRLGSKLVEK